MAARKTAKPDGAAPRGAPARARAGAGLHARIHAVVRRVPRGRVTTYGRVARLAGIPGSARLVGYAMAALPSESAVPWHRVVNARGMVSARSAGPGAGTPQRVRLEREGVRFDARGVVSLARYGWPAERD